MRKVVKALCSALCATAIALPPAALASQTEEPNEVMEGAEATATVRENDYHLAFVTGDFGMQRAVTTNGQPLGALVMFVSDPQGRIVKDAQVVTTVIGPTGTQTMQRALPLKGGYLVDTGRLPAGLYRLEAEVITGGRLLTDEFRFRKA